MCSYQPLDPTDYLSGDIVRRFEKNYTLFVAFHTVTTKAMLERITYFFLMEFVTIIDNPSFLLNTWKLEKKSPSTISFKYASP